MSALFLNTLDQQISKTPPIWLMRQAGRYLPEYRELRAKAGSFLNLCYTPDYATEVTLQPIARFGFDAAILFSDILVVPDAMGQKVRFEEGEGPRLDPLSVNGIDALHKIDFEYLAPVFTAIKNIRAALPQEKALIGFAGAPWTLATYMITGKGSPDQATTRAFAYQEREAFTKLIDALTDAVSDFLIEQIKAGVDVVQIFDSWAGVLPISEFNRWCLAPVQKIIARIRIFSPKTKIIAFPRGASTQLPFFAAEVKPDALSIDTSIDLAWMNAHLPKNIVVQGNLDPLVLLAGGDELKAAIQNIQKAMIGRPHIFNLGHGILPKTPIAHVEMLIETIRG